MIHWGASDLSFVGHVYPPLPTALASILPNPTALGIVGALAAGSMLEAVGSRLAQRRYPLWAVLLLLASLGASPSFALTATSSLASFMAITFLAIALDGFLRFAFRGYTHGGFQAGLAIGLAGLCDPTAIVCAAGFAAAAPLIARQRYRNEPAAGRATASVLLFPTVAGIAGWTLLCWRFAGSPVDWLHRAAPGLFHGGIGHELLLALEHGGRSALLTPIFLLAVLLLLARQHPIPALGLCLPLACIMLASWLGVPFPPLSVAVVLGIAGLVSLPARPRPALLALVFLVAAGGLALKWGLAASPSVLSWEHALRLR